MTPKRFQKKVLDFYRTHGRHSLPWRKTHNPYKILVSEMMLQQTQVDRVVPKYDAFLKRFPTVSDLASAPLSDVLVLWSGLGYNRRALFLKRIVDVVIAQMKGRFPKDTESLRALPGVGPYTAAAVSTFAYNQPNVIIETNIRAVFLHEFFPEQQGVSDAQLLPYIEQTLYRANPREWYWALMDYGAHLKRTNPNPSRRSAHHGAQSAFKGSLREIRGGILRYFAETAKKRHTKEALLSAYGGSPARFDVALAGLVKDGFLVLDAKGNVSIVN